MRFRKSFKVAPGVRFNVSKSGFGAFVGTRGARYSVNSSGRRTSSVGIPGTGLGYVHSSGGINNRNTGSGANVGSGGMTPSQQQKVIERHANKIALAQQKRNKPVDKLKELYAAGKISKERFDELIQRDKEITLDLVIFGRAPGLKLAERYLLDKISSEEFENLKNEVLGAPEAEKDTILAGFKSSVEAIEAYIFRARSNASDAQCNYCGKVKSFFSPLSKISDFKLCGSCKRNFNNLTIYPGFNGSYYTAGRKVINIDEKNTLDLNINAQYILEFR